MSINTNNKSQALNPKQIPSTKFKYPNNKVWDLGFRYCLEFRISDLEFLIFFSVFCLLSSAYGDELRTQAIKAYNNGDFETARKKVEQFLLCTPDSNLTPEFLYFAAKFKKNSQDALAFYEKIITQFPESKFVPYALYSTAQHFYAKKNYRPALSIYKKIATDYKTSEIAKEAIKWVEAIQKFYFIQVGCFEQIENATLIAQKIKDPIIVKEDKYHKVWIGPFKSKDEARSLLLNLPIPGFIIKLQ
ncbi:MAG: SPOR domain-containing protein [Candidatus Stahlbacteria bacterium]|nr:SPOR domain-containing protein [Candidatus Stahlbacteria bacterium]